MTESMLRTMAAAHLALKLHSSEIRKTITRQLGLMNYLSRPLAPDLPAAPDRRYVDNRQFWEELFEGRLRASMAITLERMLLFEWLPLSPGTFHTSEAAASRAKAQQHILNRAGVHQEGGPIFDIAGKGSMIEGGIGCIRVRAHQLDAGMCWLMSASSSPVVHEGIPIALPDQLYERVIGDLSVSGSVRCTLRGRLRFLPDELGRLLGARINIPRLYLMVEELQLHGGPLDVAAELQVSVAVLFSCSRGHNAGTHLTYATFNPAGQEAAVQRCARWLDEVYVRELYRGRVLTDFDEQVPRFKRVEFGLRRVMNGRASFASVVHDPEEQARVDTLASYLVQQRSAPPLVYDDWELSLSTEGGGRYQARLRYQPADLDALVQLISGDTPVVVIDWTTLYALGLDPCGYGQALGNMLFADARLTNALARARAASSRAGRALRVRLNLEEAPKLHGLRWELLHDRAGRPLWSSDRLLFSRFIGTDDLREAMRFSGEELVPLVMVADPVDLRSFGLARLKPRMQVMDLEQALGRSIERVLPHGTQRANLGSLAAELERGADLLYLAAHGRIVDGEPSLLLERQDYTSQPVPGADLAQLIRDLPRPPALVLLASCASAGDAGEDAARALGPQLVRAGVLAVVAMHGDITVGLAAVALPLFLKEVLAHGRPEQAMAAVRRALYARQLDWWRPVLFSRSQSGQLWPPEHPGG